MKKILLILIIALLLFTVYLSFITFLNVGTGGDPTTMRYFIPLGVALIAEIVGLSFVGALVPDGGVKMFIVGLVIPLVALLYAFGQNRNDVQKYVEHKATQEATCTIKQIQQYQYKVCAGGFTPLNVCDAGYGSPECVNAIKVWDQNN